MELKNRFAGKAQTQQQTQAQQATAQNQWAPVKDKVDHKKKNYDYLKSDNFIADLDTLLMDGRIRESLREAAEYCDQENTGCVLVVSPLQVTALEELGFTPKKGVITPSQVKFMKNSEMKEYVVNGSFKKDLEKFFMDGDKEPEFVEFVKNLINRFDNNNMGQFMGWSHKIYKVTKTIDPKTKKEVEKETIISDPKEEMLIMYLNHDGVPFDSFEPAVRYKVFDASQNEVTDKDAKNAYVRATGWGFPEKKKAE